ncbi:MAG: class I mannose-6-phosphate isomerase [Anaerolineaceae bacterium]|jgi:mannose-6-phosphate isomerase class I|nr:class I mannose-6-phosphate isomerase [Anaerolineaceae bacterium]
MTIYTSLQFPVNHVSLGSLAESVATGTNTACKAIANEIHNRLERGPVVTAIDGGLGIPYHTLAAEIAEYFPNVKVTILDVREALKSAADIAAMVTPCLPPAGDWGRVFDGQLKDFFDPDKLADMQAQLQNPAADVTLIIGPGAALSGLLENCHLVIYADQTRESLFNAFETEPLPFFGVQPDQNPKENIDRYCYVEGPVLDEHKRKTLSFISGYLSWNPPQETLYLPRRTYEALVARLGVAPMLFKPLYSPTAWGGNWLKELKGLPQEMTNSGQGWFIPNENSLLINWGGEILLDLPFLNLLWHAAVPILGDLAARVTHGQMPLNYYCNDQISGGHMSLQIHPDDAYMQNHFNEPARQDESYYVLHTVPGARSFIDLQPNATLADLRQQAENSAANGQPFDFERLVQSVETQPGDFILIPAGTLHASGAEQVILEINWSLSAYTPGYTFRLYDYVTSNENGKRRPLHIDRTFQVLKDRRREGLASLIQTPEVMREGEGWREIRIGRHPDMLFEVSRLEFEHEISGRTEPEDSFHALTLVEGRQIEIIAKATRQVVTLDFPDTALLPASLHNYTLRSTDGQPCKVVKAVVCG